jgi:hypothetical protein
MVTMLKGPVMEAQLMAAAMVLSFGFILTQKGCRTCQAMCVKDA